MNKIKESLNQIKTPIHTNKNFVYKGKRYPVDFRLIKINSFFFYKKRHEYKHIEDILLQLNDYDILEESIPVFIACCQNEQFEITEKNVFSLHQLSILYEVPELNKLTDEYILNNEKKLIFQSLFYKLKNHKNEEAKFDLEKEEGQIASHFFEYIDSEDLLSLPVPVLYRIINNPRLNINSMNQTNQTQFIEFLFKCLDRYKREASVLFLNIDVANERIDLLSRLLYKYKDVFDFNMINSKFMMETSSQLLSELQKLRIEYSTKLDEIQNEFQKQKQIMQSFIPSEFQEMKKRVKELESKLSEQSKFIEKVKSVKVTNITIDAQPKFLKKDEEIKLTAHVEPLNAFEKAVKWVVDHENQEAVEVQSKSENSIVLKCLMQKNIKVIAEALDGSGIRAIKKLEFKPVALSFSYTGNVQSVLLDPGDYLLEVWGAQGGNFNETYFGGYGGYSVGKVKFESKTTVYIVVGGSPSSTSGGYNGGGSGGDMYLTAFGGGGATHIGLKPGLLTEYSKDFAEKLLIVAGGGGGAVNGTKHRKSGWNSVGGCGGGFNGAKGSCEQESERIGDGGTQIQGGKSSTFYALSGTVNGEFGQGANSKTDGNSGAGGGGGFYGGGCGGNSGPGGGGSGFINTTKLMDASMFGFNVQPSSSKSSKTESISNKSPEPLKENAKQGNGYAKITQIG